MQATTLSRGCWGWLLCTEAASNAPAVGRTRGHGWRSSSPCITEAWCEICFIVRPHVCWPLLDRAPVFTPLRIHRRALGAQKCHLTRRHHVLFRLPSSNTSTTLAELVARLFWEWCPLDASWTRLDFFFVGFFFFLVIQTKIMIFSSVKLQHYYGFFNGYHIAPSVITLNQPASNHRMIETFWFSCVFQLTTSQVTLNTSKFMGCIKNAGQTQSQRSRADRSGVWRIPQGETVPLLASWI